MSISLWNGQIDEAQQQIKELNAELEGLRGFKFQANSDAADFEGQVQRKRSSVQRATGISTIKAAKGYSEKMGNALGSGFQSNVFSCFDGVDSQINQAIRQVESEISEKKARIGVLEDQIEDERRRERQRQQRLEQARRRAAQERAAQERAAQQRGWW